MLHLKNLLLVRKTERYDHLILPQRNRVVDRTLHTVDENLVVVLYEADLRRRLDRNRLADLEVVHLLLEALDGTLKIADDLRCHRIARSGSLRTQFGQRDFTHLLHLLLARANVKFQRLEVLKILRKESVEHRDVLHHEHARLLQRRLDLLDLHGNLLVALHHRLRLADEGADERQLLQKAAVR